MAVDFYGPLPKSVGGVVYLFVLVDVFTKWVTLYPVKRATTDAIVKRMEKEYFRDVGCPKRVLCDHGTQFTAKRWKAFLDSHSIRLIFSSVRHPQGNPAERIMRELNRLFRTYRRQQHKGWARNIPEFSRMLNEAVHESTGFAPCELHFGRAPDSEVRRSGSFPPGKTLFDKHAQLYFAHKQMTARAARRKNEHSSIWGQSVLEPGTLVLLKSLPIPGDPLTETKKFLPLFEGPYRVKERLASKTYILEHPESGARRGQFHLSHLKPFVPSPSRDAT